MRFKFLLLLVTLSCLHLFAESDHIILRDGTESDAKLYQITDTRVVYSSGKKANGPKLTVDPKDVYMIYIAGTGNIYFKPDGKRFSGESERVDPDKSDIIYLVSGGEIAAESVRVSDDVVSYEFKDKSNSRKGFVGIGRKNAIDCSEFPRDEVFMVRYKSGLCDIVTDITYVEPEEEEEPEEEPEIKKEPEYKVIFHSVAKGETLNKLAEKYGVTPEQIIEWNDLPAKQKRNLPLKLEMQLMIYQPK